MLNWTLSIGTLALWMLAQTPTTPSPTPTPPTAGPADIELLRSQLEFLQNANASLDESFSNYVSTVNTSLTIVGIVLTAITLFGAVLFGKSLLDFNRTLRNINTEVDGIVRRQVEREVGARIQNRLDRLEDILRREAILGHITVDYVLPVAQLNSLPDEVKFLQRRGFQTAPRFISADQINSATLIGDVVVLDLFRSGIARDQADSIIEAIAPRIPAKQSVLVVYVIGHSEAVTRIMKTGQYCVAANSPLSFIGRVVDAAYVADALR
ncbi:MAG: hypothetical protein HC879_16665 [Leptolyngbyaceae cyanobacterium SL_5_9]|nr:hypothetical protein [Leptolyngbyaceae cyanobacterium SL_5_9]